MHTATSEQHKDLRPSTQSRDKSDHVIFIQWPKAHPPFAGYEPDHLVYLSTGIVAEASVNCDIAVESGRAAASQMDGQTFTDIKLHRNDKVPTIGEKCKTITVRGQNAVVNPSVLFNRITSVLNNSSEMTAFLVYELAPQRHSLFKDGVMWKPVKSALGVMLKSFTTQQCNRQENSIFVVDSGHLLQIVVWPQPSTYGGVCQSYISYILKHYGAGSTVVFDEYGSTNSTKVAEQRRRAKNIHPVASYSMIIYQLPLPKQHSWLTVIIRRY